MRVLLLLALLATAYAKHEQYIGWKSYYVGLTTHEQLKTFGSLVEQYEVDVLSPPIVQREGVVLVMPQYQEGFTKALETFGMTFKIHADNVKEKLDYDDVLIEARNNETRARNEARMPYNNYQQWEVFDAFLDDIARRFPTTVTLVHAANSFEGRPIKYLKISTTNFEDTSKPVIFVEGGIHAREWISPPTVTWAIRKLTEDITEPDLLDRFDWILLPISNPDGYKFTFTNARFWRKTRSTDQSPLSTQCPGVDGNRNYDFFWNTVGVSSSACADTYPGARAFSEVETRVVRDIIHTYLSRMALFLTIHSYGSMILYPWGHDGSLSQNALALHTVGVAMADAIWSQQISYFPRYVVGNAALVLWYGASGAAEDYAHLVGVPLSYTYELPGLSDWFDGFHLDPKYIEQVCRETWAGIAVGARRAGDLLR